MSSILIAEDETILAKDIARSLSNMGHEIAATASSGEEAIELAKEKKPDLILMDIKLSGETDGVSAALWIHENLDIPVVYLTAYTEREVVERAKQTQPYGFLAKPVGIMEMMNTIDTALYKSAAEKRAKQSEERYRQAVEHSPNPILTVDADGRILSWNRACEKTTGYSREEAIGRDAGDFIYSEGDSPYLKDLTRRVFAGEYFNKASLNFRVRDNEVKNMMSRAYPLTGPSGEVMECMLANTDITEIKQAEQALRDSEERLRVSFDTELVAWAISRLSDGTYIEANPGFLAITGYTRDELLGRSSINHGFFTPEERKSLVEDLEKQGRLHNQELTFTTKNGLQRTILFSLGPISVKGEPCLLATMVDITDRKDAEELLKASIREKEVLLREIHHRVKNNMAIINSLLSMRSEYPVDGNPRDMLEDIRNRIRSMAVAHEILYRSENLADLDAPVYIRNLLDHLMTAYGQVGVPVNLNTDLQHIRLGLDTASALGFLLTELVSNSLKHAFTPDREGLITVSLNELHNGKLELTVADNGGGLPEDLDMENPKTMGFELINTFVEQLQGDITIDGEQGTRVVVRFEPVG
jgi:PAS domain S-box-containing protein